jgi:hypothetical protein
MSQSASRSSSSIRVASIAWLKEVQHFLCPLAHGSDWMTVQETAIRKGDPNPAFDKGDMTYRCRCEIQAVPSRADRFFPLAFSLKILAITGR